MVVPPKGLAYHCTPLLLVSWGHVNFIYLLKTGGGRTKGRPHAEEKVKDPPQAVPESKNSLLRMREQLCTTFLFSAMLLKTASSSWYSLADSAAPLDYCCCCNYVDFNLNTHCCQFEVITAREQTNQLINIPNRWCSPSPLCCGVCVEDLGETSRRDAAHGLKIQKKCSLFAPSKQQVH